MTLHDRIMAVIPDDITNGGEEFYDGFAEASRKAATLAKEADELMAEMAEALGTLLRVDDEWHGSVNSEMAGARSRARAMIENYNTYKESKQ